MSDTGVHIVSGTCLTAFYVLVQLYREKRNRDWQLQELSKRDQEATARTGHVISEIKTNTEISEKAFKVANDVNVKFLDIHKRIERHKQVQREQEEIFRQELAKLDAMLPQHPEEREGEDGASV